MTLRDRFNAWVQARVDEVLLPRVRRCVQAEAQPIDFQRLALETSTLRGFSKEVADALELDNDFCRRLAEEIPARDIAYHIDAEDVAKEVEVDICVSDVAESLDMSELAGEIDYEALAAALVRMAAKGVRT
jgi:hypothetical protein